VEGPHFQPQQEAIMPDVKPTPTQAENDDAATKGHGPLEHEPEGSPEDPHGGSPAQREEAAKKARDARADEAKNVEGKRPSSGDYQTRTAHPASASRHRSESEK
jgi:hypothetical protein